MSSFSPDIRHPAHKVGKNRLFLLSNCSGQMTLYHNELTAFFDGKTFFCSMFKVFFKHSNDICPDLLSNCELFFLIFILCNVSHINVQERDLNSQLPCISFLQIAK